MTMPESNRPIREEEEDSAEFPSNWQRLLNSGMSEIWTAQYNEQKVIVKLPHLTGKHAPRLLYHRFQTEIECHQQLDHSNIVRLLDHGICPHPETGAETPYLIQPYLNGLDLRHLTQKVPTAPFGAAIQDIASQLLDALEHIHLNGIVHRDVSMTNILIDDESGKLYLIDLGNATAIGSNLTRAEGLAEIGTVPFYPLHIGNQPSRDLFAFGVIVYALYGGQLANNAQDAIAYHEDKLLSMNHVPKRLQETLKRCWRGDFYTVRELRAALNYPRHHTTQLVRRASGHSNPIGSLDEEGGQTDLINN